GDGGAKVGFGVRLPAQIEVQRAARRQSLGRQPGSQGRDRRIRRVLAGRAQGLDFLKEAVENVLLMAALVEARVQGGVEVGRSDASGVLVAGALILGGGLGRRGGRHARRQKKRQAPSQRRHEVSIPPAA